MGICRIQIADGILRDYVTAALELAGIRCITGDGNADVTCCCDDGIPELPDGAAVVILYRRPRYTRTPAYAALSDRCRCSAIERPFPLEELVRTVTEMAGSGHVPGDPVSIRRVDKAEKVLLLRREDTTAELDGDVIRFTEREFRLLELLAERAGSVVSREEILTDAWDGTESASNAVDVYIGYLRRKLEPHLGKGVIVAVRGAGYQLIPGNRKLRIR